jgi:Leucine-rich repeat (LRR) protein
MDSNEYGCLFLLQTMSAGEVIAAARRSASNTLNVSWLHLSCIPIDICDLVDLKFLHLHHNRISEIPAEIAQLQQLCELAAFDNDIHSISDAIGQLCKLRKADIHGNKLVTLPVGIRGLRCLEDLDVSSNRIYTLPKEFAELTELRYLNLSNNSLEAVPECVGRLSSLRVLNVSRNRLQTYPLTLCQFPSLVSLDISSNHLTSVPMEVTNMRTLTVLVMDNNRISNFPLGLSKLSALSQLSFAGNLISIPLGSIIGKNAKAALVYIDQYNAGTLTSLNLMHFNLESLPNDISQLTMLEELNLAENRLLELTPAIGALTKLKRLIIKSNKLERLPSEIGALTQLEELDVSSNSLLHLPPSIGQLKKLRYLNVTDNSLEAFPVEMAGLKGLKYLDIKGNPLRFPIPRPVLDAGVDAVIAFLQDLLTGALTELNLGNHGITRLPEEVGGLRKLQKLDLSHNAIGSIPEDIGNMVCLEVLNLQDNKLKSLPARFSELCALKSLNCSYNQLPVLPASLCALRSLVELSLSCNKLKELPDGIHAMSNLQYLRLQTNLLSSLPMRFGELRLKTLDLSLNKFTAFPVPLFGLNQLEELFIFNNAIDFIGAEVARLKSLVKLDIRNNQLHLIQPFLSKCLKLTSLSISGNPLLLWPSGEKFAGPKADTMEILKYLASLLAAKASLDLSQRGLTEVNRGIGQLSLLRELNLSNNRLSDLPVEFGMLTSLQKLDLRNNRFRKLPLCVGHLVEMKELLLAGNDLEFPKMEDISTPAKLKSFLKLLNRIAQSGVHNTDMFLLLLRANSNLEDVAKQPEILAELEKFLSTHDAAGVSHYQNFSHTTIADPSLSTPACALLSQSQIRSGSHVSLSKHVIQFGYPDQIAPEKCPLYDFIHIRNEEDAAVRFKIQSLGSSLAGSIGGASSVWDKETANSTMGGSGMPLIFQPAFGAIPKRSSVTVVVRAELSSPAQKLRSFHRVIVGGTVSHLLMVDVNSHRGGSLMERNVSFVTTPGLRREEVVNLGECDRLNLNELRTESKPFGVEENPTADWQCSYHHGKYGKVGPVVVMQLGADATDPFALEAREMLGEKAADIGTIAQHPCLLRVVGTANDGEQQVERMKASHGRAMVRVVFAVGVKEKREREQGRIMLLRDKLQERDISLQRRLHWAKEAAFALRHLHVRTARKPVICHTDLKTDCFLIDDQDHCFLLNLLSARVQLGMLASFSDDRLIGGKLTPRAGPMSRLLSRGESMAPRTPRTPRGMATPPLGHSTPRRESRTSLGDATSHGGTRFGGGEDEEEEETAVPPPPPEGALRRPKTVTGGGLRSQVLPNLPSFRAMESAQSFRSQDGESLQGGGGGTRLKSAASSIMHMSTPLSRLNSRSQKSTSRLSLASPRQAHRQLFSPTGSMRSVISEASAVSKRSEKSMISTKLFPQEALTDLPPWAAPEIMADTDWTEASDVFTFGKILWDLFVYYGQVQAQDSKDSKFEYQVETAIKMGLRPPIPDNAAISTTLTDLIEACWRQTPEERPSFEDVCLALSRASCDDGEPEAPHLSSRDSTLESLLDDGSSIVEDVSEDDFEDDEGLK